MTGAQDNSPRVMQARFNGKCHKCCGAIEAGSAMVYVPEKKETYHTGCGREAYYEHWHSKLIEASRAINHISQFT